MKAGYMPSARSYGDDVEGVGDGTEGVGCGVLVAVASGPVVSTAEGVGGTVTWEGWAASTATGDGRPLATAVTSPITSANAIVAPATIAVRRYRRLRPGVPSSFGSMTTPLIVRGRRLAPRSIGSIVRSRARPDHPHGGDDLVAGRKVSVTIGKGVEGRLGDRRNGAAT
jgi:hypothetical protein